VRYNGGSNLYEARFFQQSEHLSFQESTSNSASP
jgi:hypothetical protein